MSANMPTAAILACGAWLKNRACLLQEDHIVWTALHGDLGEPDNCLALEASVHELVALYGADIVAVAHDLHPDFFSSRLAVGVAHELGVPAIAVQHHHAHIGVIMAEYGLSEPVIGLALDGVGLGTDGVAWGGELLFVDGPAWKRLGHLQTLSLPGGDTAAREPWRMAAAVLHTLGRADEIVPRFAKCAGHAAALTVQTMLERGIHCPPTTGAGRWFDAAAGALGLSVRQTVEAEAAIALERCAQGWIDEYGMPEVTGAVVIDDAGNLDLRTVLAMLFACADCGDAQAIARGAAQFHLELAAGLTQWAASAARRHHVSTIALGGGCFFNRIIRTHLTQQLTAQGLRVLLPATVSCGDDALALGQAWVASTQSGVVKHHTSEVTLCV